MKNLTGTKRIRVALAVLLMVCLFLGGSALAATYPESAHPYASNTDLSWTYTHPTAAETLKITFSADTELEANYDKIYITGADGVQQTFTGTELQNATVSVSGNSFTLRLTSDNSVNKNGFTITNITAITPVKTGTCGKTGSIINWTLDTTTGLLTLTGSGEMADYDYYYDGGGKYDDTEEYYTHPWDNYLTQVTEIVVGEGITSLGEYAFGGLSKVTKVTLPSTLVSIGNYAFEDVKITSVTLPEGLTTIGNFAFTGTSITSVALPSTIASLAEKAFPTTVAITFHADTPHGALNDEGTLTWDVVGEVLTIRGSGEIPDYRWVVPKEDPDYCTSPWFDYNNQIKKIIVSSGVTTLGQNAFNGLSGVTSVSLPYGLTTIRAGALSCYNLSQVTVPSTVTSVAGGAFSGSTAVTGLRVNGTQGDMTWKIVSDELIVSGTMPDFSYHTMTDRYDTNYPETPWRGYFAHIKEITVEAGITRIGNNAFYGCYNAAAVNIPSTVTSMGEDAFYNCKNVTTVDYITDYSQSASGWPLITFDNISANPMAESYKAKLYHNGTEITWFSGLQGDVSAYAFANCQNTFGVAASGGKIYKVGDYGFYNCTNLTEASLPTSLYHVGERAFYGCSSLNYTYRLFEGLTYIGNEAFYGCSSLTGVYMKDDSINAPITFMGHSVFGECDALTTVRMAAIETLPAATFYGCNALTSVTLDDSVKVIDGNAFANCTSLQNIQWPPALESIGRWAFEDCTALNVSSFPETLKTIDEYAFYRCSGITGITLPAALETLGDYSFYNCTSLKNVVFEGTAPSFGTSSSPYHFKGVTANVTYRPGNSWKNKTLNYGGSLTWKPVGGACGTSANWLLTEDGMLRINGSGTAEAGAWSAYAEDITEILITSNITAIADNTFAGLNNVTSIGFAGVCTEIGENAFSGITADVYWAEKNDAMRAMCEAFETPYEEGFGGTLNWRNPVCYVSESSSSYTLYCSSHNLLEQAATDPTCTANGNLQYWSCTYYQCKLCFEDAEAGILKPAESFVVPATGHGYHEEFLWQEDGSACRAQFTCVACGDVQTLDAAVTSEEAKAPECLVNGDTLYTATVVFEQNTFTDTLTLSDIPATGHTEAIIAGFAPSCEEPGMTDYIFCEVCYADLQMSEEIPAAGHSETVTLEALEPTCTEAGRTQEISCSVCEKVLTASETIAETGHSEYVSAEAVAPDCVNTGLTEEISCNVCHEVLAAAEEVPALGHTTETDAAVEPDCENTGLTEGSHCSVCDEVLVAQETIDALGHTEEIDFAVEPTDYETGLTQGSHCAVCGETIVEQQEIPANFTYDGTTVIAYNGSKTDVVIPDGVTALSAALFRGNTAITSVRLPDSVASVGAQTFFGCTSLKDVWLPDDLSGITQQTFYQVTARLHASADSATAVALSYRGLAFTTEDGFTLRYRVTSAAGTPTAVWVVGWHGAAETVIIPDTINQIPVVQIQARAFAGHNEMQAIRMPSSVTTIAADAFDGCSDGLKVLSPVDAYAREWAADRQLAWEHDQHNETVAEGVDPTCTETGLTEGSWCDECEQVLVAQEIIPATGHDEVTDAAVEATCTQTGLTEGKHCAVCGEITEQQSVIDIDAQNHINVVEVDGYAEIAQQDDDHHKKIQYKDHCCADCGTMIAQNVSSIVVEDIDHQFMEYTHSEGRDFAQLDEKMHSYTGVMIKNQHCEDCGYHRSVVVGEETLLQGHYYGYLNDVCIECGYVNQCQHEVTSKYVGADESCQFTSVSATHHTATGLIYTTVWCNLCGTYLEMSEEDTTGTFEHEAYEDGICIYCGYEGADVTLNSCEHENTVTGDNEIGQEFVYENLNCDATHTYGGHEYGTIVCLECGEIIRDFQSVHSLVETTPHDYSDGYCALCGHTCSHSKTESIPGTTEGSVCSYCGTTLAEPPTASASVSLVPASRIVMDAIPFGMAMDLTVEAGRIHAWIDGDATDWDQVVTFNEPLLLHNPDTDETWYENSAVNFGMSIRAPEGAAYVSSTPGSWQNDDAIVAALEASELEDASYNIPGWWNEIALIDGTDITTVSLGGEGYNGPTTYAVRWADENGQTILIEKVDLCFEHSASNETYATSPVLIPAEDILANVTDQSYVRSAVDDGCVSYEFVSDWPDIVTEVNAPAGTVTYSMHKQFREGHPEQYELTDGRCVGYQLYGWQEGTDQSTSSDLLCWYDANGKLIGGGWITIEAAQRELSQGPSFKLPAAITEIRAEAFVGSGAQVIILPDGCLSIGSRAFADCANLQEIHIPASVQSIADDALDNCGSDLIIVTTEGSTAQAFAEDNDILCVVK